MFPIPELFFSLKVHSLLNLSCVISLCVYIFLLYFLPYYNFCETVMFSLAHRWLAIVFNEKMNECISEFMTISMTVFEAQTWDSSCHMISILYMFPSAGQ